MRPLTRDRETIRPGRLGLVRLLRQPFPLLLGLRLHLVCTLGGLPVAFALTGAKADERQTLLGIFDADPALVADRPGQTLIADKHYYGTDFERTLDTSRIELLRKARKGEPLGGAGRQFTWPGCGFIPVIGVGEPLGQVTLVLLSGRLLPALRRFADRALGIGRRGPG